MWNHVLTFTLTNLIPTFNFDISVEITMSVHSINATNYKKLSQNSKFSKNSTFSQNFQKNSNSVVEGSCKTSVLHVSKVSWSLWENLHFEQVSCQLYFTHFHTFFFFSNVGKNINLLNDLVFFCQNVLE